jgi:PhnB protein
MASNAKPIPPGFEGAVPYLCCKDAARAIEFYKQAFGATEVMRLAEPSGRIGHAEIKIGTALLMLADEYPEMDVRSPQSLGGSPVTIHLYVDDVDALADRAVGAGAKLLRPVADQFYGDRSGRLSDPFGHVWIISTHTEDVAPEEMQRRYQAMMKPPGGN